MRPTRVLPALVAALASLFALGDPIAGGSQIAARPLAEVVEDASLVVVGVVEDVDLVYSGNPTTGERFVIDVRVIATLRGESKETRFRLPLHIGGIRGFDTPLSKGDQAVFFLRSLDSGEAALQTWGSVALFPGGHFQAE